MTRLFVKKLTVMDFSYLHSERGMLGESWLVDVELTGNLDHQGMVLDFGDVKKIIKRLIDEEYDHKLLVPEDYAGSVFTVMTDGRWQNRFTTLSNEYIEHCAPPDAYCRIAAETINTDNVARHIEHRLMQLLPANVSAIKLNLYPEIIDGAFYHYSHGLKQHAGNCQRIAHGHRSRIEINDRSGRRHDIEKFWAAIWQDIYIGTRSDIRTHSQGRIVFSYQACQGQFDLSMPEKRCYLIDTDSTVENLAAHIARQLADRYPHDQLTVSAFEGIDKGAIATTEVS